MTSPAVDPMVWLLAAYGLFLLAAGWGLDYFAHRASIKTKKMRQGGFTYHEDHDAWLCPEDQWLWPTSFDPENRVMRYRGTPSICNSCPVKDTCTTSNFGREMVREIDPWPHSETGRFHRGLALAVAMMGAVLVLASIGMYHRPAEIAVLVAAAVVIAAAASPLAWFVKKNPSNFPTGQPARDPAEALRHAAAGDRYTTSYHWAGSTKAGSVYEAKKESSK